MGWMGTEREGGYVHARKTIPQKEGKEKEGSYLTEGGRASSEDGKSVERVKRYHRERWLLVVANLAVAVGGWFFDGFRTAVSSILEMIALLESVLFLGFPSAVVWLST